MFAVLFCSLPDRSVREGWCSGLRRGGATGFFRPEGRRFVAGCGGVWPVRRLIWFPHTVVAGDLFRLAVRL